MANYLIMGANSEVGKNLAKSLIAEEKHNLMLVSRSTTPDIITLANKTTKIITGIDLTSADVIPSLEEAVSSFFSEPFNCIVSVGEFWDHRSFEEVPFEEAMRISNSHYATVYCAGKIVLPHMKKLGGGRFMTFSCNSVRYLYPNMAPFCSAKAAVEALTQCIAHEYAEFGVSANCFRLSSLKTPEVVNSKPNGDSEHYMEVSEVTNIIRNFSENMNAFLNGSIIELYEFSKSFYHKGYFERIR